MDKSTAYGALVVLASIFIVTFTILNDDNVQVKEDPGLMDLEKLNKMSCPELLKENITGLKFNTDENILDFINSKVYQCMKNQNDPLVEDDFEIDYTETFE